MMKAVCITTNDQSDAGTLPANRVREPRGRASGGGVRVGLPPSLSAFLSAAALVACGESPSEPPPRDFDAPAAPSALTARAVSSSDIDLTWTASTDNVGIAEYRLYRDEVFVQATTTTSTRDEGRTPGVRYCYAVSARDAAGNESSRSESACAATVNLFPVARLTGPVSALLGVEVTFDATASADPDGNLISYQFNFGDGSPSVTQPLPVARHTYTAKGTFSITLTVRDNHGLAAYATTEIVIRIAAPEGVNISKTPTLSQGESFFGDGLGRVYVVWDEFTSDILFSRSRDDGQSFDPPKYVIDPNGPLGSRNGFYSGTGQKRVIAAGEEVHIVWTIFDVFYGGAEVFYIRSADGGASFTDFTMVSENDGKNSVSPAIARSPAGVIGMAWSDGLTGIGVFYRGSSDGGPGFGPVTRAAPSGRCPAVALSEQHVYLAWVEGDYPRELLYFARSADGGRTFTAPVVLNMAAEKSWCPVIGLDESGIVYLAWEDGPALAREILFSRSVDGGGSFSPPTRISTGTMDSGCPSIAIGASGSLHLTWSEANADFTRVTSYLVSSTDAGASFSPPTEIPTEFANVGCYQLVARDQNRIGLGWHAPPTTGALTEIFYRAVP
jgi:PKD repeat protein